MVCWHYEKPSKCVYWGMALGLCWDVFRVVWGAVSDSHWRLSGIGYLKFLWHAFIAGRMVACTKGPCLISRNKIV